MDVAPTFWGFGGWAFIFVTIYHHYKNLDELMYYLDHFYLPCKVCRDNLSEKKNKYGFGSFAGVNEVRNFYIDIYNDHHKDNPIDKNNLSNLEV